VVKIVIWLLVGGTLTYAVVMSVLSIAGHEGALLSR